MISVIPINLKTLHNTGIEKYSATYGAIRNNTKYSNKENKTFQIKIVEKSRCVGSFF